MHLIKVVSVLKERSPRVDFVSINLFAISGVLSHCVCIPIIVRFFSFYIDGGFLFYFCFFRLRHDEWWCKITKWMFYWWTPMEAKLNERDEFELISVILVYYHNYPIDSRVLKWDFPSLAMIVSAINDDYHSVSSVRIKCQRCDVQCSYTFSYICDAAIL